MDKKKVLFICVHNSARSQMAEDYLNVLGKDSFIAESAGLEPGKMNPLVVAVMKEAGRDISQNKTKSVLDFYQQGKEYDYVITVCDEGNSARCPVFPGGGEKRHWPFDDPSSFQGTWEEKLKKTRIVRDRIKDTIREFIDSFAPKKII